MKNFLPSDRIFSQILDDLYKSSQLSIWWPPRALVAVFHAQICSHNSWDEDDRDDALWVKFDQCSYRKAFRRQHGLRAHGGAVILRWDFPSWCVVCHFSIFLSGVCVIADLDIGDKHFLFFTELGFAFGIGFAADDIAVIQLDDIRRAFYRGIAADVAYDESPCVRLLVG
ncbi:hypothetical protein ASE26_18185 [Duganella sp. Root198D2]|nr:hypothetical protein ASE26_18185 [Duganella sp. Root198D2]